MTQEASERAEALQDRVEALQDEIERMQDLIHRMGAFIDGQIWRTSFSVKGAGLTIYTYSSADEPGSLSHAKQVARHLQEMGFMANGPVRNSTTGEPLEGDS
jgi:hypothetical protein